jgi:hypothetical protein
MASAFAAPPRAVVPPSLPTSARRDAKASSASVKLDSRFLRTTNRVLSREASVRVRLVRSRTRPSRVAVTRRVVAARRVARCTVWHRADFGARHRW